MTFVWNGTNPLAIFPKKMESNTDRYTDTLAYLRNYNRGLGDEVANLLVRFRPEVIGAGLSLSGTWWFGSKAQHRAVRSLLLCHRAYLHQDTDFNRFLGASANMTVNDGVNVTKRKYLHKSEQEVLRALRCYLTEDAHPRALAAAAREVRKGSGLEGYEVLTREPGAKIRNIDTCYRGIQWWLFKAGFVSIRWMLRELGNMAPHHPQTMMVFGDRSPVPASFNVPEGYIVHFTYRNNPGQTHWAVSLGQGVAFGVNNGNSPEVQWVNGGLPDIGAFRIASMHAAYDSNRNDLREGGGAVATMINPATVGSYY